MLGVEFYEYGVLRPEDLKLVELISFTKWCVKLLNWKPKTLQSVLGRWKWVYLLKRSTFSVFDKVYDGINGLIGLNGKLVFSIDGS